MVDVLSPQRLGRAEITHFRVETDRAMSESVSREELWLPGDYCELEIDGIGWMWDIPDEWLKNQIIVDRARGDVLIVGLGMGFILHPILAKPEVRSVHVIEIEPDVCNLILPSLAHVPGHDKLTVEIANGQYWPMGLENEDKRYDAIWLDAVPCRSKQSWWLKAVEMWENLYRPFLCNDQSFIGHWAYLETIQLLLDDAYGKERNEGIKS